MLTGDQGQMTEDPLLDPVYILAQTLRPSGPRN